MLASSRDIIDQAGWHRDWAMAAIRFIALIHKQPDSGCGVSFPDVPGVIAVADNPDTALAEAADALDFALEDWEGERSKPRTLDELRGDAASLDRSRDAVVAAVRGPGRLAA